MTLASVSSSTQTAATTSSTSDKAKQASMDKDAFLKLLVAQLSHQDPTQPTEGTEYVTQLAQFSLVEQSMAQSQKLDVVSTQLTGMSANEAASLVGKNVTVRGSGVAFDGVSATNSSVTLSANAAKVTVQIQDASGKTVRTLDVGARSAGAMPIAWDGKTDDGQPAAKGTYTLKVSASTAEGGIVNASQDVSGSVQKVTYDKGYPEVTLDSGVTAPISDLVSVGAAGAIKK
jgi:flagellar basal-body rod modification protein FlgD